MKRSIFFMILILVAFAAGCATDQEGSGGYKSSSSGHAGHHH